MLSLPLPGGEEGSEPPGSGTEVTRAGTRMMRGPKDRKPEGVGPFSGPTPSGGSGVTPGHPTRSACAVGD